MKGLTLHANVHGLQRVETDLLARRLRSRLVPSNTHLRELLLYPLHTCLLDLLRLSRVASRGRLIPSLRSSILWLLTRSSWRLWTLNIRVSILRLLRHPVCRLLWHSLLALKAVASSGYLR